MLLITTSIYESEWIFWRENICPSLSELWFPEPILSQNLQKYLQIYGPTSWNLKSLKAGNWSHSTSHLPHLLIDALFNIAGKWNQRKCSSADGWTMTFWYICETTLFSSKFKKKKRIQKICRKIVWLSQDGKHACSPSSAGVHM